MKRNMQRIKNKNRDVPESYPLYNNWVDAMHYESNIHILYPFYHIINE